MHDMGRNRLGEAPTVLASIRIPGEHADVLTADGGNVREAIYGLVERKCKSPSGTVMAAVKKGTLIRPDKCEECGKSCIPHGHHDDYTKLLDVRWLCIQCHEKWHIDNEPIRAGNVERRIVVILTRDEYEEIKWKSGDVPVGRWVRRVALDGPCHSSAIPRPTALQPGKEKGHEADRASDDAAGTADVSLGKRGTDAPRRPERRTSRRHGGTLGAVENIAHSVARDSGIADAGTGVSVRHTAESDWHSCLCPACSEKRKKLDLEIGEIPTKKERSYGGKK